MLGALLATTYILYLFRSANQSTLEWMYIAIAAATDFSLSSRLNLTLCVAVSRLLSISDQIRLETIHFTRIDDIYTTKFRNSGKPDTHSSSASTIRKTSFRLESCSILVKISDKAVQAFAFEQCLACVVVFLLDM
jgi:hypothetical protein